MNWQRLSTLLRTLCLLLTTCLAAPLAAAGTFTVNSTTDAADAVAGNGVCATSGGVCTLRAAVEEANALAGSDTINLAAATYTLTLNNDLNVTSVITLNGVSQTTTIIDGNNGARVVAIGSGNTLSIVDLTVRNGNAGGGDGGGFNNTGTLNLTRVIVRNNNARDGAGIWSRATGAVLNATDSSFIGNTGRDGAGVYVRDSQATFNRVTFSTNSATRDGGGLYTRSNTTSVTNVTYSQNSADDDGGGYYFESGTGTTVNTTFYRNTATDAGDNIRTQSGTPSFTNTLADNNNGSNNCSGSLTAVAGNLAYGSGCTGFTNGNPLLAALTDNGGFTATHALATGSAAIDTGTGSGCPATDQRGTARPLDGDSNGSLICDTGAYELAGAPLTGADLAVSITDDQDPVTLTALLTYTVTVQNNGPDNATGVVLSDNLPALATYQSATPSQGSCAHTGGSPGGTLACTLGDITAGSSATVELIVSAPSFGASLSNSASVTGNESDPNSSNNSDTETTTVVTNANRLCYLVADGNDVLTRINTADFNPATNETTIGPAGVNDIEAIAFNSANGILYAANLGQFGSMNLTTGAFTFIGNIGSGSGSLGTINFNDVDGLTYDATTGVLYGVHARSGNDVLLQINMTTGARVANAFGAGVDYVQIPTVLGNNITDDIAVDPTTGILYASINNGGTTDRLIRINKATGASTDVALITVPDIEGLGTDFSGQLWGTSGTQNILYEIDKLTGVGSNGRPINNGSDYEGVDCYAISPSVSVDIRVTKTVDNATPTEGATSTFTITVTNAGPANATALQLSDLLPAGLSFGSATPGKGIYNSTSGNWYVGTLASGASATLTLAATVDAGTSGSTLTNTASVAFVSQGDTNPANNTASASVVPAGGASLLILKSSRTIRDPLGAIAPAALAIPGAVVEYEITITNSGGTAGNEVRVTDAIPASLNFLPAEYAGDTADIEIIIGNSAPVYCVAEAGSDTNTDGCFLDAGGTNLTVSIPVSIAYPTGLTVGTVAPNNSATVHFRATIQ